MCASNDFGCLLIWTSSDVVVNWFEIQVIRLSIDLRFKWFGCQSIWDSNELVVNWSEIPLIWLSIDLRFKWVGCQVIWDSNDLVVNRCVLQMILVVCWFELQVMWLSIDLRSKWFGCQLIWDSNDLVVNRFEIQMSWLSIDLRFKWFGCQSIWDSNELVVNWFEIQVIWMSNDLRFKWVGCQVIWDSSDLDVKWFEIQVIRLSIDLRFKWFGCQSIWDSNELVVNWSEIQVIWLSIGLRFKWVGCQLIWDSSDLDVKWFEVQGIWLSTDVWFKWFCQAKLFCETSFKNEALKIKKNEAFLRDFLQHWSFETQKRNFSARLPSKMKLWSSKTKLFCETSFKIEPSKLQNQAFLRDFLQNWSFEDQKRSISARLPSKLKLWNSKTKLFCETSFKNEALKLKNEAFLRDFLWNDMSTRHLASELQYVLAIFNWMLQKYCACHKKVEPRHTNSCNCHAKWSLQGNTSVTWNLQPFHGFSVGVFEHRHRKARNHCACHVKRIVSDPLEIHHACQRFCNPHELLRLPRILQGVEIPAPATQNTLSTSKNVPSTWCFNDFGFQIDRTRRRGANFAKLNFQKCSEPTVF